MTIPETTIDLAQLAGQVGDWLSGPWWHGGVVYLLASWVIGARKAKRNWNAYLEQGGRSVDYRGTFERFWDGGPPTVHAAMDALLTPVVWPALVFWRIATLGVKRNG